MIFDEIINAINGQDAGRLPKCAVSIDECAFDVSTKELVSDKSKSLSNTLVNVSKLPSTDRVYVSVDFTFPCSVSFELSQLWASLQNYGKSIAEISEESKEIPQIFFTLIPLSYEGKYYVLASSPIFWGLISNDLDEKPDTVRVVFDAETVSIYETNSIDYKHIESIVDEEIKNREAAEEARFEAKEKESQNAIDKEENVSVPEEEKNYKITE